jgi:hypothetical protein
MSTVSKLEKPTDAANESNSVSTDMMSQTFTFLKVKMKAYEFD